MAHYCLTHKHTPHTHTIHTQNSFNHHISSKATSKISPATRLLGPLKGKPQAVLLSHLIYLSDWLLFGILQLTSLVCTQSCIHSYCTNTTLHYTHFWFRPLPLLTAPQYYHSKSSSNFCLSLSDALTYPDVCENRGLHLLRNIHNPLSKALETTLILTPYPRPKSNTKLLLSSIAITTTIYRPYK